MGIGRQHHTSINFTGLHGVAQGLQTRSEYRMAQHGFLQAFLTLFQAVMTDTSSVAPVFFCISSTVPSGANSSNLKPLSVTSITPRSVMIKSTTPLPVRGKEHCFNSLRSSPPSLVRATCSI